MPWRAPWGWSAGSISASAPAATARAEGAIDVADLEVHGEGRAAEGAGRRDTHLGELVRDVELRIADAELGVAECAAVHGDAHHLDGTEGLGVEGEGTGTVVDGQVRPDRHPRRGVGRCSGLGGHGL